MKDIQAARALGWASVAIAAAEIFGQGAVEREMLGIDEHPTLMRALGARELASGAVILSQTQITPTLAAGLWSRVIGDAMNGALLAAAATRTRRPANFVASVLPVLAITGLDLYYALRVSRRLAMAQVDVKHRAALSELSSPAAQPPPPGVPAPGQQPEPSVTP